MGTVGTLVVTVLALFLIKKVLDFWNAIKSVQYVLSTAIVMSLPPFGCLITFFHLQ